MKSRTPSEKLVCDKHFPPDFSITLEPQSLSDLVYGELLFVMIMEADESGSNDMPRFRFRACRGVIEFLAVGG